MYQVDTSRNPNVGLKKIKFKSDNAKNREFIFLIDTGASVSIVTHKNVTKETPFDPRHEIMLKGIGTTEAINTLGKVQLTLSNQNFDCKYNFYYVNANKINIDYDGIIGHDFLSKFNANINYSSNSLTLSNSPQLISIKPRSVQHIPINVTTNATGIIDKSKTKLDESIIISDHLLIDQNTKYYPIINVSDKEIQLPIPQIHLIEMNIIPQKEIFHTNSNSQKPNKNDRIKLLKENIRTDHMNKEEKESLIQICENFKDIFHLPGDLLTSTKSIKHDIVTTDPSPIFTKTYRYPKIHEAEVNKQIKTMLEQNIIQPSTSPWSSPVWVVPKKLDASGNKKWRVVIDYRKLNEVTISDAYPLPNIEEILDQLGQSIYFTTLDLASGFHQIEMNDNDKQKTAFTVPSGHYEFNRMPFGLKNSPSTFQRLMNSVLSGLQGSDCFVYLDDIVIYANSLDNHNEKLCKVFQKLRDHNLKLQPDKCEFLRKEVAYLGHIITSDGVRPNPEKIEAITKIKQPKNPKDIKSFLGLVGYYRKFIPNFAKTAKPLTCLLKKDTPFKWTEKCQDSFDKLKNSLITKPILQYPKFDQPFILTTDCSNEALGSVLSQGEINSDLPIAYHSRTLNAAEQNYSTTEKELLAIVDSVKHFRPYLYGQTFTIVTDHRPLTWLMSCKDPSSRLVRWRLKLMEYDYKIIYKPGKQNSNADCLSRPIHNIQTITTFSQFQKFHQQTLDIPEPKRDISSLENISNFIIPYSCDLSQNNHYSYYVEENCPNLKKFNHKPGEIAILNSTQEKQKIILLFVKQYSNDNIEYPTLFECLKNLKSMLDIHNLDNLTITNIPAQNPNIKQDTFKSMLHYLFPNKDIRILDHIRIEIHSKEAIDTVLRENHDDPLAGHPGFNRMYNKIRENYSWKTIKQDIQNYIKNCKTCQTVKTNFKPNKSPMVITTTAKSFNEQIAMDIMGPYPETNSGNRFILTIQDDLTKYIQAYPMTNHNAEIVAIHLLKYCSIFGFPSYILTDQGTEFTSKLFREISKLLQIKHKLTSPYHPQTNGSLERTHLTLRDYIRCYIDKNHDWDELISLATFSYNTHKHKSTQEIPYTLVFGEKPKIPSLFENPKTKPTYSNLAQDMTNKLKLIRETAKEQLIKTKHSSKKYYDKTHNRTYSFTENQLVLLKDNLSKAQNKKLNPEYKGPFKIIQVHNNNTATIELSKNKRRTYHFNQLKPFVSGDNDEQTNDDTLHDIPHDPGPNILQN